jgi:HD-GYP domain-containing protein (c-di-GMP phosphodiesterase class II)
MNKDEFDFVVLRELRVGLYVDLDVGWMAHPFPSSRFKITSERQIEVLKGLGADRIRFVPAKSDPIEAAHPPGSSELAPAQASKVRALDANQKAQLLRQQRAEIRASQQQSLALCERRFTECAQQYRKTIDLVSARPLEAAIQCSNVVQGLAASLHAQDEVAIRLLTESAGDKAALHPVNVTVVALLLGRAMQLPDAELQDLGLAAFVHDIGKVELPERVRKMDDSFSGAELRFYQEHVARSVRLAREISNWPCWASVPAMLPDCWESEAACCWGRSSPSFFPPAACRPTWR